MRCPSVSCVLATRDRPEMVARACAQFARQDYPGPTELRVVDNGVRPLPREIKDWLNSQQAGRLNYIYVGPEVALGDAYRIAAMGAEGEWIHKWDDDDLYAPGFLSRAVRAGLACGRTVVWGSFLIVTSDGVTRVSAPGMLAGGAILTPASHAEQVMWFTPGLASGVDRDYLEKLNKAGLGYDLVSDSPEMYTAVRHGGNTWKTVTVAWGESPARVPVDVLLKRLPEWKAARG